MYRLIVCDIDETLVAMDEEKIPLRTVNAIRRARDMGYLFTLATGRIYPTARSRIEELGVDLPVIAAGGADIRMDHVSVDTYPVPDTAVRKVLAAARRHWLSFYLFCGDVVLTLPKYTNEALFAKWASGAGGEFPVQFLRNEQEILELGSGRIQKILLWAENEKDHRKAVEAFSALTDEVDISCGEPLNIEVYRKGVNKGTALERVCEMLGIGMEEVMAVGDSGNDVEMLQKAGLGVAVENAMEEAARAADVVTLSTKRGGVGKAIEDYVLSQGRIAI